MLISLKVLAQVLELFNLALNLFDKESKLVAFWLGMFTMFSKEQVRYIRIVIKLKRNGVGSKDLMMWMLD
jgi:hypothetical protein